MRFRIADVGTRISIAMTRPEPLALGKSDWHRMPSSTKESWALRQPFRLSHDDFHQALLLRVKRIGLPENLHRAADRSQRVTYLVRHPGGHLAHGGEVFLQPNLALETPDLRQILERKEEAAQGLTLVEQVGGSSMVMMCSALSLLTLSSMAASVVDLPLPVGPVTSTRPRGLSQI